MRQTVSGIVHLRNRIRWLGSLRILSAVLLFLALVLIRPGKNETGFIGFPVFVGLALVNIVACTILALPKWRESVKSTFAIARLFIFWDAFLSTGVVYLTSVAGGEVRYLYTLLGCLFIINAGFLLFDFGAYLSAALHGLGFACVAYLLYWHVLPFMYGPTFADRSWTEKHVIGAVLSTWVVYGISAWMSSAISKNYRKNEEALEETKQEVKILEQQLKNVIDGLTDPLFAVNESYEILHANPAAFRMLGISGEKSLNSGTLKDHVPGVVYDEHGLIGRWFKYEPTGKWYQTQILEVDASKQNTKEKMILFRDSTVQKEMEEKLSQNERMAMIGEMAARLAHEIRNPLTSIRASVEILSVLDDGLGRSDLQRIILQESDRLNQLLNEFLVYARNEEIHLSQVDLSRLMDDVCELFSNSLEQKNIRLSRSIDTDIRIVGDESKIRQVLWNLLKNAEEASPQNGHISCTLKVNEQSVTVAVEDSGSGIPTHILPKIFQPFFSTKTKGTGLGLAIAQKVMIAHHGKIDVDANPGKGARFELNFRREEYA